MKYTKKIILKILVGILVAVLIGGIIFVVNSFTGNPISAMMANKAIEQYVDKNYSTMNLQVEKARYNFKVGKYAARVQSKMSIDTKFAIYYCNGKVQGDSYESYVLGMFNTWQRLSDEYSTIAKNIVAKELGYENNTTRVIFNKSKYKYGNVNDIVELDMKLDKSLPIDAKVTIRLDLTNMSLEDIAKILTDAHKEFVKNDCNFSKYGFYTENNNNYIMVDNVAPEDIGSGELVNLLQKAQNNNSMSGIRVFIKE